MSVSASEVYAKWRYRLIPDHVLGEILSKNWIDNAIPVAILILAVAFFSSVVPDFLTVGGLSDNARQLGELMLVVLGMTIVMLAGGIDLSVGSNFALTTFLSLGMFNALGWPVPVVIALGLLTGALVGLVNGILIGFLRLRAFLTTLVTLIIVRAIVDTLILKYQVAISNPTQSSDVWDFMGDGSLWDVPCSFIVALIVAVLAHVFLTRLKLGWHIQAVGGSRRSAYNAGISVRRTVCLTYVISGMLAAAAGILYAARLNAAGSDTGSGLEVSALTAAVLGGVSLGGGRGSVMKGMLGAIIVLIIQSSLVQLGLRSGAGSFVLGVVLLIAVAVDVRWLKNRMKVLSRVYVSPAYFALPPSPTTDPGSPFALNDKLSNVDIIGLAEIEGPEDVIVDREGNLYCGNRYGDVVRFFGPDHKKWEIFAHIGGGPLGLAFDRDDNLVVCVSGMGLYMIRPDREVVKLTDETNRSLFSIIDDSRMRFADDLDIAPDGRIFFSEATIRFDITEWAVDALEARGNGRILCYDPRNKSTRTVISNLQFPNGICVTSDGQSILFAETWGCRVQRYWFAGPKAGQRELVIENLPGYPDNINRASDGNYWLALVGMRAPAFDLAWRMPGMRRRMVNRIPHDEWLYPNMNTGCVFKFDASGRILDCLWDRHGVNHPMITSMREDHGFLYIGGTYNNRIGKWRIPGADETWGAVESLLGAEVIGSVQRLWRSMRGDGEFSVTVPPMDGALNPNNALEEATAVAEIEAPDNLCVIGRKLLFTTGADVLEVDDGVTRPLFAYGANVTALAAEGDTLAIATADGRIRLRGGNHDGIELGSLDSNSLNCVTALTFADPDHLLVCIGSNEHPFERWKHDLMQLGASGSVWRFELPSGKPVKLADRLAFPFGVATLPNGDAIVSESWRHRLLVVMPGKPAQPVLSDLPAYPGRISPSADGKGAWLSLFAPRRQLTEFVLREPAYRNRMMAEMPPDYWVGPTLAPMSTFLEPLQGGTLKKLAAIKPWAPSRSYGLVVRLDADWQPTSSFHSRADGSRHGVMSAVEFEGRLYAASRGANAVVAIDLVGDE